MASRWWTFVRVIVAVFSVLFGVILMVGAYGYDSIATRVCLTVFGAGLMGTYLCWALSIRNWDAFRLSASGRARRQIDGEQPYFAHEIPALRRYAEYRVWSKRTPLRWFSLACNLVTMVSGLAWLSLLGWSKLHDSGAERPSGFYGALSRVAGVALLLSPLLSVLAIVAAVFVGRRWRRSRGLHNPPLRGEPGSWRRELRPQTDAPAQAFLARTHGFPDPAGARR